MEQGWSARAGEAQGADAGGIRPRTYSQESADARRGNGTGGIRRPPPGIDMDRHSVPDRRLRAGIHKPG